MLSTTEIGKKIAIARKMNNFSQAQLANLLAVSAQAVGKWERGESMPDILMFGRLAEILEVDLNYFDNQKSPPESAPAAAAPEGGESHAPNPGWDMSGSNWTDADFSGLKGLAERFSGANIERCRFIGSELCGLAMKNNNIKSCDFSGSDLRACQFARTNFEKDVFTDSDFSGSQLVASNLKHCNFSGANLTNVVSKWSQWQNTVFLGAVFSGTIFQLGQLTDLHLEGHFTGCAFENCDFARVEFSGAVIRNTFFKNCKLRRAKFSGCQADKLSFAFMKACKADVSDVEILEA